MQMFFYLKSAISIRRHVAFFFAALCLIATPLSAQVVRLPEVPLEAAQYPVQQTSHPDSSAELLETPFQPLTESQVQPLTDTEIEAPKSDVRPGMFQKLIFQETWLAPSNDSHGFGQDDMEAKIILALPCPTRDSPLVITPGFATHYLDGPENVDIPGQLYEAYTQFRWLSQVTPQLGLDLTLTPGVYSDFEQESTRSFRLTGHGAAAWTYNPTLKFIIGAAYLDRPDYNVIPIGGVIWTPNEDYKFDLIYPEPKASKRIHYFDSPDKNVEGWLYLKAEFAGDVWAIEHSDGTGDRVFIRDSRIIIGLERKSYGGLTVNAEVGYVFKRHIQFTNTNSPSFDPSDTVLLRLGLMY